MTTASDDSDASPRLQVAFWARRLVLLTLLSVAYVGAVRPARTAYLHTVAQPSLSLPSTPRSQAYQTRVRGRILQIRLQNDTSLQTRHTSLTYHAPWGSLFVIPAAFLLLVAPRRPYWAYLAAWHGILAALGLAAVATGVGWTDGGFDLYTVIHVYVVPMTSLGAVPLAVVATRRASFSALTG